MRLLHCADLHLEHSFAAEGLPSTVGAALRAELRASFERILALAVTEQVDLVTIGGGLYEHRHATADTARFLQAAFGRCPLPVLIAPGEDDPFLPGSIYHMTEWPKTVTIAAHRGWRPQPGPGAIIWVAGHVADQRPSSALPSAAERSQPNIAIFPAAWGVDDQAIEEAGFTYVLASDAPVRSARRTSVRGASLTFGGEAHHTVALLEVEGDTVSAQLRELPVIRFVEQDLDTSGLLAEEAKRGLSAWLAGCDPPAVARARMAGLRRANWGLDVAAWERELSAPGRYLQILDATHGDGRATHEQSGPSVGAEFSRRLSVHVSADPAERAVRKRALDLGLASLEA